LFSGHGYCSPQHWIEHYGESMTHQGNDHGTMHPDDFGTVAIGQAILKSMVSQGFGDGNTAKFFPAQTFVRPVDSTSRYDWSTQPALSTRAPDPAGTETIHTCPDGYAMSGLAASDRDVFKCQKITLALGAKFLDFGNGPSQRTIGGTTMHGCPGNSVMIGYHG